jgi:hypothetical protein
MIASLHFGLTIPEMPAKARVRKKQILDIHKREFMPMIA